jgi:hypothetical protein
MFTKILARKRTLRNDVQVVGTAAFDGRLYQDGAEIPASELRRNLGVDEDQRVWTTYVRQKRDVPVLYDLEPRGVAVVSDRHRRRCYVIDRAADPVEERSSFSS